MSDFRFIAGAASVVCTAGLAFGQQCDVTPPAGAVQQTDVGYCGNLTDPPEADPNGGCNEDPIAYQNLGAIASGETIDVYGNVGAWDQGTDPTTGEPIGVRDLDWYLIDVPDNGILTFTVRATNDTQAADPADFLFFVLNPATADCSGNVYEGYLPTCDQFVEIPVAAGTYGFVATINGFGSEFSDCTTNYVVQAFYAGAIFECGDPAQGSCAEANGTAGCDDSACCEIVCAIDDICCEEEWDSFCVDLAFANCGYFAYVCENPNPSVANDCVAGAFFESVPADNTITQPFDTTGCNTDGPPQPECGSGVGFEQIQKDIWFIATPAVDGFLTASTCNGGALWDTKIAAYSYDAAIFDPSALPDYFIGCNEDCGDAAFASELQIEVVGGTTYLIRVGGYDENSFGPGTLSLTNDSLPIYECTPPTSFETYTQNADFTVVEGGVSCAGGGITTANQYARKFLNRPAEKIGCVDFGVSNGGAAQLAFMRIFADSDGSDVPIFTSLQEINAKDVYIPGGGFLGTVAVAYDALVDVPAGTNLVFEYDSPASPDGFSTIGTNAEAETYLTYIRSDACGITDYVSYADIGFPGVAWVMFFNTWDDGGPVTCEGDLNEDGFVNGADLTILLAAWDTSNPIADLNGDGNVGGADLTILLAAWAPGGCP